MADYVDTKQVTLAILAGGEGSRMGQPKSLLTVGGQPILQYLHTQLAWPGPTLLITAPNRTHPPGRELFSAEIPDPVPGQGPLRGVLTALESASTELLLITTVDMPRIRPHHLHHLIDLLQSHPTRAGLFLTTPPDQVQPFPLALRTGRALTLIRDRIQIHRSVYGLSKHPQFTTCPAPENWSPDTWTNLNTPDDLENFLKAP